MIVGQKHIKYISTLPTTNIIKMVDFFLGDEVSDDDLRDFGVPNQYISSCLQPQIDFMVVCPAQDNYDENTQPADTMLWPIVRNLARGVIENSAEWKVANFRGKRRFVMIVWH